MQYFQDACMPVCAHGCICLELVHRLCICYIDYTGAGNPISLHKCRDNDNAIVA